jgi:hypothetical protein
LERNLRQRRLHGFGLLVGDRWLTGQKRVHGRHLFDEFPTSLDLWVGNKRAFVLQFTGRVALYAPRTGIFTTTSSAVPVGESFTSNFTSPSVASLAVIKLPSCTRGSMS